MRVMILVEDFVKDELLLKPIVQPFAEGRGMLDFPDEGRDRLAREAASRYARIRSRCKEDIQRLETRIREWIEKRK